jgi:peptidoglycan/xylan/chitin deacetylase (PgdA/CDA1 family)
MVYPIVTPRIVRKLFPGFTWEVPGAAREVYLSFDDGPEPTVTPWVLDRLEDAGVKATFFCIGKNVEAHPGIFRRILNEGHTVGNHSFHHLNGWKNSTADYVADVARARNCIPSRLFRPPYGRISLAQARALRQSPLDMRIVMWSLLSGDFDTSRNAHQCWLSLDRHLRPGQIVTFHDSVKAYPTLTYVLPKLLEKMRKEKYVGLALEP